MTQQIHEEIEPRRSSTKGSCATLDLLGEDTHSNIPNLCELYIDEEDPCLVATEKVYKLRSTMHHQMLDEDYLMVVVEQIRDADP
ncbi:hypothetical protein CR513_39180, partial [Mucuna pruriens]